MPMLVWDDVTFDLLDSVFCLIEIEKFCFCFLLLLDLVISKNNFFILCPVICHVALCRISFMFTVRIIVLFCVLDSLSNFVFVLCIKVCFLVFYLCSRVLFICIQGFCSSVFKGFFMIDMVIVT